MFPAAIEGLVRGVQAYFDSQNITATVRLGWTPRDRQDNQGPGGANRVVFIPGEFDPSTSAAPPKALKAGTADRDGEQNYVDVNGVRYRAVAWNHDSYTCSVWAADPDEPNDQGRQIAATLCLREQTRAAIYNSVDPQQVADNNQSLEGAIFPVSAGFANIEEWGQMYWTLPPGEMGFGRELTFSFVLYSVEFDAPITLAYPQPAVARNPAA